MNAWTLVQVSNEKLARHGQAGVVQSSDGKTAEVKFDTDGEIESVKVADLRVLG